MEERGEFNWVLPGNQVDKALGLMLEHDFSQLPVADEVKRAWGIIMDESLLEEERAVVALLGEARNALVEAK